MNFFERQADVRRQSRLLVLYFVIAVVGIVGAMNLVAQLALNQMLSDLEPQGNTRLVVAFWVTLITAGIIGASSLYRISTLKRGGGGQVAASLGGTRVPPDTTEPALRRLHNVVEELSIAATMPVPEVFVLRDEQAINAFAAGHSPADAAIAVTSGALEQLNRAELEGVIGHELSHVANGDMRLNMRLMGTIHGIEAMAISGRVILYGAGRGGRRSRGRSSGKNDGAALIMVVGMAMMIIGFFGVFMGRIIKAAVSRQREYLADASAVQFTRQTEGLTGALKKIGGLPGGSKLEDGKVDEVSHMLFGDGLKLASMFATHPPIVERIQALDPAFNEQALGALAARWQQNPPSGMAEDRAMGLVEAGIGPDTESEAPGAATAGVPLPSMDRAFPVDPAGIAATTGAVDDRAHRWAKNLLASVPDEVMRRAHGEATALPLVLGLVMAAEPSTVTRQHDVIAERLGPALADAARAEAHAFEQLHPALRLPLAEITFPALRQRPADQLQGLIGLLHALIWVDGQVGLHEYFLARLVGRSLEDTLRHSEPPGSPSRSLSHHPEEATLLLSTMARVGHDDPAEADRAYADGCRHLGFDQIPPRPPNSEHVVAIDGVWDGLDKVWWPERSRLIEALVTVATHDGVMTVAEIELLRLVCAMLRCPLPPQVFAEI